MFQSIRHFHTQGFIEFRTEHLTGFRSRICPERLKRGIGMPEIPDYPSDGCPFCPELIESVTPTFPGGNRIKIGESVTFPNLYPFASYHVVTAITKAHMVTQITADQLIDALNGQVQALRAEPGYHSINWNFLPSAGASLPHPHLQGLADPFPSNFLSRYLLGSSRYYEQERRLWWDDLKRSEVAGGRHLLGDELFWYAHPVPIGEREIRCILPVTMISEFEPYVKKFAKDLVRFLLLYHDLGTGAWNMSIFFGTSKEKDHFSAFCSLIARINPNSLCTADSAFMERLHHEPIIMTLPEDLAEIWRESSFL